MPALAPGASVPLTVTVPTVPVPWSVAGACTVMALAGLAHRSTRSVPPLTVVAPV